MIDMVDTLLEVSRIEHDSAQQSLQIARVEGLREIVQASIEPLRAAAERKQLQVEVDLPDQPLALEGDGGLLIQVVRKLVDNAVKYSLQGGRVAVRGRADGDGLRLEVDRGIGIAPEHLPRIFDKFYMVDGGIARRAGGTGVGLYLAREIVRLHHGSTRRAASPGAGGVSESSYPGSSRRRPPRHRREPRGALVPCLGRHPGDHGRGAQSRPTRRRCS